MRKKTSPFLSALAVGVLILISVCWMARRPVPASVTPDSLVNGCGIIRYQGEQAGVGFFVRAEGEFTNTYFITALHCLTQIRKREKCAEFDLKVVVKKREAAGSIEIALPCNDANTTGFPLDFAAVQVSDSILERPDVDVAPFVFRMTGSPRTKACSGEPGFLLYPLRMHLNVGMGSELFTLVSQRCDEDALAHDLFPIFFRKGALAFRKEDPSRYEPMGGSGKQPNLLIIDCRAAKGNSGAPVFLSVKETFFGDRVCETPHLLGILVEAMTAKGEPQKFDLPLMVDGMETGRIKGEQAFEENDGLSIVVPIDYLAQWLMERDRDH